METSSSSSSQQQEEWLAKQSNIQFQIDALMRQTLAQRSCGVGTDCLHAEKEQQLRQAYESAEVTAQSAPAQLETARRKYYRFKEGPAGYDAMREKELKETAAKEGARLKEALEAEWKVADTFAAYYDAAVTNMQHSAELAHKYKRELEALQLRKKQQVSSILTNDRKTYYEQEATETLVGWNRLWWFIYYFLLVVLVVQLVRSDGSRVGKIGTVLVMAAYPWFIHPLVLWAASWVRWLASFWPKNVYNSL